MNAGEWQPQAGLQVQLSTPSGRRLSLRSSFLNGERCSRSSERKKGRHVGVLPEPAPSQFSNL